MRLDVISEFLSRLEIGYYSVIDSRLHRNGRALGTVLNNGYLSHSIGKGSAYAHRILFAYYFGIDELAKYESINHKDGNKLNNCRSNLEGLSLSDNSKHQWSIGLAAFGSECSYAILTEIQVNEIRKLLRTGISEYVIAEHYRVARSTVRNIRTGANWKHLAEDTNVPVPELSAMKRPRSDRKLSADDMAEVKRILDDKTVPRRVIASMFGVSRGVINKVAWGLYGGLR